MTHTPKRHLQDEGPSGVGRVVLLVWGGLLAVGLFGGDLVGPEAARAQTTESDEAGLIDRYREARYRALARRHLRQQGQLPVYPLAPLPTPNDSLRPPDPDRKSADGQKPSFPLHDVRPVRHLERGWFQERFAETQWAYLGDTSQLAFLDTTRTPDLRARLQAKFGDPTQTLADRPLEKPPEGRPQFEYWFVVNDSIPVQVTDVLGPMGRGLIVAVERAYRDRLRALRDTLLTPLQRVDRAPHVDYHYDPHRERWYRTGYDGQSFFLEQIPESSVLPGRRPRLDAERSSESSPSASDGSP